MKKSLSALMSMALCVSLLLSACQGGEKDGKPKASDSGPQATAASSVVTDPGTFPVVREKKTLKFFAPQAANIENLDTNEFTVWYEKETNVHIEWELAPASALAEKKRISLASGEYPDVYFAAGISNEEQMLYGPKGIFVPFNGLIDKYSVYLKKLMGQYPTIKEQITGMDGNIYALPLARDTFHVTFSNKMWINSRWLKKLNLEMPKTTEEFYNVLKAFKEKDPNGNGQKDELPLVLSGGNPSDANSASFIMCAFIYDNGTDRLLVDKNDKIGVAFNRPEWKKGLEYLRKLYAEGLIDSAIFTNKSEQVKQLVEKVDAEVVGSLQALTPSIFANLAGERHKSFDALPPVKGPDGTQTTAWAPYNHVGGTFVITKACKNPEVAMRWVDWLFSWEGALRAREGLEGRDWRRPEKGTKSYRGTEATWERIKSYGGVQNVKWDGMTFPHNMCIHGEQVGNEDIYSATGFETRLFRASKEYEKYRPEKVIPPLYLTAEDSKEYNKMKTDINDYVNESMVRFITGNMDISKDWDKYLKSFETLGLNKYIEMTQKAYDSFLKMNKK